MPEKIITTIPSPEKQIVSEEVAELEKPIKTIIEKIRSRIENGDYGLIVGDDASGRIPALILGNFIKKVSEQKGFDKPNIIFIPGKLKAPILNQDRMMKKLEDHIGSFSATKDKRILIVTDTVLTGLSLKILVRLFHKIGFICDIATIGVETDEKQLFERDENLEQSEVISGEYYTTGSKYYSHTPQIYREKTLSGVFKKSGDEKSTVSKSQELDEISKELVQQDINQVRQDAGVVTDHLLNWYESAKK